MYLGKVSLLNGLLYNKQHKQAKITLRCFDPLTIPNEKYNKKYSKSIPQLRNATIYLVTILHRFSEHILGVRFCMFIFLGIFSSLILLVSDIN